MAARMHDNRSPLPEFGAPPVVETVLGVEFAPLGPWGIPHFGLFWHGIRGEFDRFEVQPHLSSQIEQFGDERGQPPPMFIDLLPPQVRCWFISRDDKTLIQVQNSRFMLNWRKGDGQTAYPRYEQTVRPRFVSAWQSFSTFVKDHELGDIAVAQCEVTYVNHLEIGVGWKDATDIGEVFPMWAGKTLGEFLPPPERVHFGANYLLPGSLGRLRVTMQPAFRSSDGSEILQLTLTARGRPQSSSQSDVINWLDLGREWVVRGFADITSPKMHSIWNRAR